MRRLIFILMATSPVTLMGLGCSVTGRQLNDFATSTAIRVFVQTATSIFEAAVLQGAAT